MNFRNGNVYLKIYAGKMGFFNKLRWENGIWTPLQDPLHETGLVPRTNTLKIATKHANLGDFSDISPAQCYLY